jgi:hypothetical protein
MTTVICILEDGSVHPYVFETAEEAQEFADDVREHSDEIWVEVLDTITTRKQALSDLLGV